LTPLRRMGQPMEVAYGVLCLASDEASCIAGTALVIDGGFLARYGPHPRGVAWPLPSTTPGLIQRGCAVEWCGRRAWHARGRPGLLAGSGQAAHCPHTTEDVLCALA